MVQVALKTDVRKTKLAIAYNIRKLMKFISRKKNVKTQVMQKQNYTFTKFVFYDFIELFLPHSLFSIINLTRKNCIV